MKARFIELREAGLSAGAIARVLGFTKATVVSRLRNTGMGRLCTYDGPTTESRIDELHARMDAVRAEYDKMKAAGLLGKVPATPPIGKRGPRAVGVFL